MLKQLLFICSFAIYTLYFNTIEAQTVIELNYGIASKSRILSAYGNSIDASTFQSPGIGAYYHLNNWLALHGSFHFQSFKSTLQSGFIDSLGQPQYLTSTGVIQRFSVLGGPQIRFYHSDKFSLYTGLHLGYSWYRKVFKPSVNFTAFNDKLNNTWFLGATPLKAEYKLHSNISIGAAINIGAPYFFVSRIALHLKSKS